MSAALSPLEQLEQQSSQGQPQQAAQPASNLSPLEQLEQMSAKPATPKGPNAYQKATASGPYAPAGAAEKAMGEQFGDNTAQAKQALKSTGEATLATAGGVGLSEATPVIGQAIAHLGDLDKIVKVAKAFGWGTFGYKEARELYKDLVGGGK